MAPTRDSTDMGRDSWAYDSAVWPVAFVSEMRYSARSDVTST